MKYYGLDVHKEFMQVCELSSDGKKKKEYRVGCSIREIEDFGGSLHRDDEVVLEATFHSWAIYTVLGQYVDRVVVANPLQVKAIAHARVKTDKVDAHILAQLLRTDFIPEVKMPGEHCWELRQLVTHRKFLTKGIRSVKNSLRGLFNRKLLESPEGNILTERIQEWIAKQSYSPSEKVMVENLVELVKDLQNKVDKLDERLVELASRDEDVKLLMTIPGVSVTVAIGLMSAIEDVKRFDSPQKLAAYFGLVPRISQSAGRCYHGSITKTGRPTARWLAVEAAHNLAMNAGPLTASFYRLREKKGYNVAVVALARKLVVLVWHMLKERQPYRYAPIQRTRQKLIAVTPDFERARGKGLPKEVESLYEEMGLPKVEPASPAERRACAASKRTVTRLSGKTRVGNSEVRKKRRKPQDQL